MQRGQHEGACLLAKRARAGVLRAAQVWQPRRPMLRLSGLCEEDGVERDGAGTAAALVDHWLPVLQAEEHDTTELEEEAARRTERWDVASLAIPSEADVGEVIRRGRRTALGPGRRPFAMGRNTGKGGARTLCRMLRAFVDGAEAPPGFNEAWLAVLPKGSEPGDDAPQEHRLEGVGGHLPAGRALF